MPAALSAVMAPNQPFSADLSAFRNWNTMLARYRSDAANDTPFHAAWQRMVAGLAGLSLMALLRRVNELINNHPYVTDEALWHTGDYWATPGEFMAYGGDCEDFATAKYLALRAIGLPEGMMRIAIVRDLVLGQPHAILLVSTPQGVYVLDNQSPQIKRVETVHRYQPIYSLNQRGWWYHGDRLMTA